MSTLTLPCARRALVAMGLVVGIIVPVAAASAWVADTLLAPDALQGLGWTADQGEQILRALGFAPAHKAKPGEARVWRRRRDRPPAAPARANTASPFAALAALNPPPAAAKRRRRPRRRRVGAKASMSEAP